MKCPHCGMNIRDNVTECGYCGGEIAQRPERAQPGSGRIGSTLPKMAPAGEPALEGDEEEEGGISAYLQPGEQVLIGELLHENQARASWTGSPLFVFVAEHHMRTDLYLPRVLAMLGDQARDLIHEEDRDLFACAFESRLEK